MKNFRPLAGTVLALLILLCGCAPAGKLRKIRHNSTSAELKLPGSSTLPEITQDFRPEQSDTLKITDPDGNEMLIMRAVRDEQSGEMVATEELSAAVVTARFRNVAERRGRVNLEFQIIVSDSLRDSRWQLRFSPRMVMLGDTSALEPIVITGEDFRRTQLRGYQQYERFLHSITRDSSRFVNKAQLEYFLRRNLPEIYAFRTDSSFVSDEQFASSFGVTQAEALEHYTNRLVKRCNSEKLRRKDKMFHRYVKNPIGKEGIRLDTVIRAKDAFIYNYVQTVHTVPRLKKVDILLGGSIHDQKQKLYSIPESDPLTFYISSLSSLADRRTRYKTEVISRRVEANTTCRIEFPVGGSKVDPSLEGNFEEITRIKGLLRDLAQDAVFDLDSITITASCSPEGSFETNERLARSRSAAVSTYFRTYLNAVRDSLRSEAGFGIDIDGNITRSAPDACAAIAFTPHFVPEDWETLDALVEADGVLTRSDKLRYRRYSRAAASGKSTDLRKTADLREAALRQDNAYPYIKSELYPRLRRVRFDFHLHRKGMVQDTVHTMVVDTTYMEGLRALEDRDFARAITLLRPYADYNAALAYMAMDYNASAREILLGLEKTPAVNYMLSILYSRAGDERRAVECYLRASKENPGLVHRGNLDPEISTLIKKYGLNPYSTQLRL